MISGTPPIGRGEAAQGFLKSAHGPLGSRRHLSRDEMSAFARAMMGDPVAPFLLEAVACAGGRAREIMFEARDAGAGVDQRQTAENSHVPLAVVNGAEDPLINLDYLDSLAYANLWEGRCHRLPGARHAAFWSVPDRFDPMLERFVGDVAALTDAERA